MQVIAAVAGSGGAAGGRDADRVMQRMRSEGIKPDLSCYNAQCDVIGRAARHGRARVHEGLSVLRKMRSEGLEPDVSTFRCLMDITAWCARRGRASLKDAELVVKDMCLAGRGPSPATYNGLMAVVAGLAGRDSATVQDGYSVLQRMRVAGMEPTSVTYSAMMAVVAGAARHGKATLKDGELVLQRMREARLLPDVITYNAMLAVTVGVAQQGRASLADGARVVAQMTAAGVTPDAVTLNTLLEVVAEAARHGKGGVKDAEKVLDMMRVAGVPADITTFRALNKVWIVDERRPIPKDGVLTLSPSEKNAAHIRYSTLLGLVARSAWEGRATLADALRVEERMLRDGIPPMQEAVSLLLEAAVGSAAHGGATLAEGEDIVERARERGELPTERTFVQLMSMAGGLAKAGRGGCEEAKRVLRRMRACGINPGAGVFETMVGVVRDASLRDKSQGKELEYVVEQIEECGVSPDAALVVNALEVAKISCSTRAAAAARRLFELLPPKLRTSQAVTGLLCAECAGGGSNQGALEAALAMLKSSGSPPGVIVYKTAMGACTSPATVLWLSNHMVKDGLDPNSDEDVRRMVSSARDRLNGGVPALKRSITKMASSSGGGLFKFAKNLSSGVVSALTGRPAVFAYTAVASGVAIWMGVETGAAQGGCGAVVQGAGMLGNKVMSTVGAAGRLGERIDGLWDKVGGRKGGWDGEGLETPLRGLRSSNVGLREGEVADGVGEGGLESVHESAGGRKWRRGGCWKLLKIVRKRREQRRLQELEESRRVAAVGELQVSPGRGNWEGALERVRWVEGEDEWGKWG